MLVLCALLLSSCDGDDSAQHLQHPKAGVHRVEVLRLEKQPVTVKQTLTGTLEAVNKIRLYNEESGRITRLPFYEGDRVKKGQVLVQLDDTLLKLDVARARAAREQAELDLSRVKTLLPKKIATEEEVAKAETEVDLARAEEKRQLTRLQRSSIRAPIDGIITDRLYETGDILPAQTHILTLVDPDALRLKAGLAERWMPLVKTGQPVNLRIDALAGQIFKARLNRIYPTINPESHKGIIEILLKPAPPNVLAGQFARADIVLNAGKKLTLPVPAVQYEIEGAYIYRIKDNKERGISQVEKVSVETGRQFGEQLEIVSGIKTGDRIVVRGFIGLRDGKSVEIAHESGQTGKSQEDNQKERQ